MAKQMAPTALVAEAIEADTLFRQSWTGMKIHSREFGHACEWIQQKELHKYIRRGNRATGYQSFEQYVQSVTGGECSRTTIYDCINIYRLTIGEYAIDAATVDKIPKKNLLRLAALPPRKRTSELVSRACRERVNEFAVTAQSVINEDLPIEKQRIATVRWQVMVHPHVAELLDDTIADFSLLKGVVLDGDTTETIRSKALAAICTAARSWSAEEIRAAKETRDRNAPVLPENEKFQTPGKPSLLHSSLKELPTRAASRVHG